MLKRYEIERKRKTNNKKPGASALCRGVPTDRNRVNKNSASQHLYV